MAVDIKRLKAELARLNKKGSSNKGWKPKAGDNVVRIVPIPETPGFPFVPVYVHYRLPIVGTVISPVTNDEHDPFVEMANELKAESDTWKLGTKLEPKVRYYARIIDRANENAGVQIWSFSKTVFEKLGRIMSDDDYGDISDLEIGTDITVDYTPAANEDSYASTDVQPKRKSSVATTDPTIISQINDFKIDLQEMTGYELATEAQMEKALQKWVDKNVGDLTESGETQTTQERSNPAPETKVGNTPATSPDAAKAKFEDMFND